MRRARRCAARTARRTRAACSPTMPSAKSRATRSSWPLARTGSKTSLKLRRPPMRTPNNERLTPDIVDAAGVRHVYEPQRRCILSGEHETRLTLVRLAVSPDGLVLPYAGAKASARGAWIGVSRSDLDQAIEQGPMK